LLAVAALLIVCVPLHYAWRLSGRNSPWPRRFLGWSARAAGLQVEIRGAPLGSHVLFIANHLSWLDILVLAGATGTVFVSKGEVARWPAVGWLAALNDTVFVERAERGAVRGQADALRDTLATGRPVALFPEGTVNDGTAVLPFRPSLLASLFPPLPGVRLQPVAIDYGAAAGDIAWHEPETIVGNAIRMFSRPGPTPVLLQFLDPLEPSALADRKALAQAARAVIVAALRPSAQGADRL
jgi:1-acyl-sn-glycerol-3-phosphate acyltransferase